MESVLRTLNPSLEIADLDDTELLQVLPVNSWELPASHVLVMQRLSRIMLDFRRVGVEVPEGVDVRVIPHITPSIAEATRTKATNLLRVIIPGWWPDTSEEQGGFIPFLLHLIRTSLAPNAMGLYDSLLGEGAIIFRADDERWIVRLVKRYRKRKFFREFSMRLTPDNLRITGVTESTAGALQRVQKFMTDHRLVSTPLLQNAFWLRGLAVRTEVLNEWSVEAKAKAWVTLWPSKAKEKIPGWLRKAATASS